MSEIKKSDVIAEASEKAYPIIEESKKNKKIFLENIAVIISVSVVILSIVLYAFNNGYFEVFNIPSEIISIDLVHFIPIAIQLSSLMVFVLFYISSLKTDKALNKNQFNLLRILWGTMIVANLLLVNNINELIDAWLIILIIIAFPVLVEIYICYLRHPKKEKTVNAEVYNIVLENVIQDNFFVTYYIKYGIYLIILPIVIAPFFGRLSAYACREYQTFIVNDIEYVVISNNSDKVLAQHAIVNGDNLEIYIDQYYFFSKEGIAFEFNEFDDVKILNSDKIAINENDVTNIISEDVSNIEDS